MVQKKFAAELQYLHIPVHCGDPETFYYVEVWADGVWKNEFLIGISAPGEQIDHYAAMDLGRYPGSKEITLLCKDKNCPQNLFDGIINGGKMKAHPDLYPDLYHERSRQQIHFSPARGWMNDPNGLFFKDGRYDIQLKPVDKNLPGILIELKAEKNCTEEQLKKMAEAALGQIIERKYDTELKSAGVEIIYKYGVAFSGKKVEVVVE